MKTKFKRMSAFILAILLIVGNMPMELLAKPTISVNKINTMLTDMDEKIKNDPSANAEDLVNKFKEELKTYIAPADLQAVYDKMLIMEPSEFAGKTSSVAILPDPNITSNQLASGNVFMVGSLEVNNVKLESLYKKYFETFKEIDTIFTKWEDLLVADPPKDISEFILTGKDKYKLQSDIAVIEAAYLIPIVSSNTRYFSSLSEADYKTEIDAILEELKKQTGITPGGNERYNAISKTRFTDEGNNGKLKLHKDINTGTYGDKTIFEWANLGNEKLELSEDDLLNTNSTNIITTLTETVSFPGVFHKGIESLYSLTATIPSAVEAKTLLDEYANSGVGNSIYSIPYSSEKLALYEQYVKPTGEDSLYINEMPSKDHLFQLRTMLQYLITIPDELSALAGSPELVKSWLNENHESYKSNMELYRDLIGTYKATGFSALASNLELHANDQEGIMKELLDAHGISESGIEDISGDAIERNKIFQNPHYYELLAWTSAFTPFETDLNDYEFLMAHVSGNARNIYEDSEVGRKRTPVLVVDRNTQVLTEVQAGNNIGLKEITLRQFMKQVETGDVMLFAQAMSRNELEAVNAAKIIEKNGETNADGTVGEKETIVAYNEITSSTTSSQYLGPIYFSTSDANYSVNRRNRKYSIDREDVTGTSILDDMAAISQGYDFSKYAKEITNSQQLSQHLTPTHGYLNYMLMHNTLENGGSKSKRVQSDLDRAMYVDFIGNIVTHSGVVVVPAFANTAYYQDISRYNLSHAMFLNSYPTISSLKTSKIELIKGDENKLLVGLYPTKKSIISMVTGGLIGGEPGQDTTVNMESANVTWNWGIMGLDTKGKFTQNLKIKKPNTTLYKSMEKIDNLRRKKEESSKLEFFNPVTGIVDVGISYARRDPQEIKRSSKVFTFTEFDELTITGEDFRARVALNGVSTNPLTGDWLAMISLNLNHILDEDNGLNVMSLIPLGHLYSVLMNCSDDVYAMSKVIKLESHINNLKDDKLMSSVAGIFEGMSNFLMQFIKSNILVYTPTLDNLTLFKDMSSWITSVGITFIVISISIGILYLVLGFFRNNGVEVGKIFFIFLMVPIVIFYTVNLHPSVLRFVFQDLPSKMLKNETYLAVADESEAQYKTVNEYLFTDKELIRESSINFVLNKLTQSEALEVRRYSDENLGYTENPLYAVKYDHNIVNVLEDKVYLKGLNYYMDVFKLFDMSTVEDIQNHDYTFRMEHDTKYGYDMIAPKTPFYHLMETLTYTINTFTEGTSVAMRTIDYGHFVMSTGRSKSYFNSIFFIAPERFSEYLLAYDDQQNKNLDDLIENDDYEFTAEEINKFQEELNTMTPMTQKAMVYMMERLGNLEDWMGVNKLLGRSSRIAPFEEEFLPLISTNDWYPDLAMYDEREIDAKVKNINDKTKNFVLSELVPVMGYMSDENTIKTVALYASMQFNKEFSRPGRKLEPSSLEPVSMSNHFISRSIYIPTVEMFASSSNSLSYYLVNEGIGSLIIASIDIGVRSIIYIIPIIAIFLLGILPIIVVVMFPARYSKFFNKIVSLTKITIIIAFSRFFIIIFYKISRVSSDMMGTTGGIVVSLALSIILIAVLKVLVNIFVINMANTTNYIQDSIRRNAESLVPDTSTGFYGGGENEYDSHTSSIYGHDNQKIDAGGSYMNTYNSTNNNNNNNNYNGTFSNTIYDSEENKYVDNNNTRASYSDYNSDGTGWSDNKISNEDVELNNDYEFNRVENIYGDAKSTTEGPNIIFSEMFENQSNTLDINTSEIDYDKDYLSKVKDNRESVKDIEMILESMSDMEI